MPSYKAHVTGGGGGRNHSSNNRNRQSQGQQQQQTPPPSYTAAASASAGAATANAGNNSASAPVPLFNQYPISSVWEFTLKGGDAEKVRGAIYCTDAIAQMVVVTKEENGENSKSDNDYRLLSVHCIQSSRQLKKATESSQELLQKHADTTGNDVVQSRKILEEREKKELKRAQERLRHVNTKASPEAQNLYDKLLKACNDVEWKQGAGDVLSIVVMEQIQVDPPYKAENCRLLRDGTGEGSLDRVQKIVMAASNAATPT